MYYEEDRIPYDAPDTVIKEQAKDKKEKDKQEKEQLIWTPCQGHLKKE